jgi:hypothetical protein
LPTPSLIGLGGRFRPAPQVGELVLHREEVISEIASGGIAFAELLHADTVESERPAIGVGEDLARIRADMARIDDLGIGIG